MLYLVLEGPYGDSLRALAEGSAGQLAPVWGREHPVCGAAECLGSSRQWRIGYPNTSSALQSDDRDVAIAVHEVAAS